MHVLVLLSINRHMKFEVCSYIDSKHMIRGRKFKTGHMTMATLVRSFVIVGRGPAYSGPHGHTHYGLI